LRNESTAQSMGKTTAEPFSTTSSMIIVQEMNKYEGYSLAESHDEKSPYDAEVKASEISTGA